MTKVGVRDLKTHASEIVRRVRDENESFELTYRGETVGRIIPDSEQVSREELRQSLARWHSLVERLAEIDTGGASAEEVMQQIRRDL